MNQVIQMVVHGRHQVNRFLNQVAQTRENLLQNEEWPYSLSIVCRDARDKQVKEWRERIECWGFCVDKQFHWTYDKGGNRTGFLLTVDRPWKVS